MTKTYDQTPQIDFQVKTKAELEAYSSELSRQFVAINTDGRLHWIDQDGEYHITSQKANVTTVDPTAGDDVDDGYYPLSMWINQTDDKAFICLDSTVGAAVWLEIKDIGSAILGTDFGTNSILKRDIASTPVSLGIEENRLIGRPSGGVISSLTGAQAASIIDAFVKSTDTASDIKMTSGGHSVKDAFDDYLGHGWSAGHTGFQDNGDGTVTIDAGEGYLRSTQDSSGAIDKYDVPGNTLILTDNATNWIYQSYNGGSPVLAVSSSPTSVRGRQDINIIKVVDREGTDLRPVSADNGWKSFHSIVSQKFFDEATARGYRSSYPISGAQIATKGTRNLYISSGIFWGGPFRSESDEIDTSAGDTATQWYGNTSVGFTSASITQTNNTQYFNGTALASLTVNQYTIRWEWLLSSGDQLHQMFGTGQYVSEELAREAAVTKPSDIPPRLARFGTFVGAKIVRQGSDTIIDLPYVTSDFSGSGVPAHDATLDKDSNPLFQHITQEYKDVLADIVFKTNSQVAINMLREAANRPIDVVCCGDSNMLFGIYGFDHGLNHVLSGLFGQYASPIYGYDLEQNQNYIGTDGVVSYFDEVINPNHANIFIDGGYGSITSDKITYQHIKVKPGSGRIDLTSNLRYWMSWGGYNYGSGQFQSQWRIESGAPITLGSVISTNTGNFDQQISYLDLAANPARNYVIQGLTQWGTVTAPFTFFWQRVEDLAKTSGISVHSLYAVPGAALRSLCDKLDLYSLQQLTGYFAEVRRLQLARGCMPKVVVYMNFGFNDIVDTQASRGYYKFTGSTAAGYKDNLIHAIERIETVWSINGWEHDELSFFIVPSHVISDPNDTDLTAYRNAVKDIRSIRKNLSCVDLSEKMTYAEAVAGGWYDGGGVYHLTQTGYEAVAAKILDEI